MSPNFPPDASCTGILLAEPESAASQLVASAIASVPNMQLLGETSSVAEALDWIKEKKPDVLVFGRTLLGPRIAPLLRALMQQQPSATLMCFGREAPELADGRGSALSRREREVLRLVASGLSSREAAAELKLSVRTIENHRARISRRTGLRSIAELTLYAAQIGLISSRVNVRRPAAG